jgi:sortase A
MRLSAWVATLLIVIGCGCLAAVGMNLIGAAFFQETAAKAFERELATAAGSAPLTPFECLVPDGECLARDALIGRLEIPRLNVSVIVQEGDDVATLAQAVGHLPDTALPWEQGNAVLAGHRDTFFRPLKHVREGDEIRMTTARGTFDYRVTRTEIVEPDNLSPLAPTSIRSLTLVTCYPFAYVGRAPQRFIVHAR